VVKLTKKRLEEIAIELCGHWKEEYQSYDYRKSEGRIIVSTKSGKTIENYIQERD